MPRQRSRRRHACRGRSCLVWKWRNGTSWGPDAAVSTTTAMTTQDATRVPVHMRAAAATPMVASSAVRMPDCSLVAAFLGACFRQ